MISMNAHHESNIEQDVNADVMIKTNILIVDNSRVARKMVISTLSYFEDFNFIQAEDGLDALEKLKKYSIKLIFVDYYMPRMDGIEFMKEARKIKEYKKIPIIMLTAESEERKMINGYVAGARVYMTKPFKPEELMKIVETIRYWHIN